MTTMLKRVRDAIINESPTEDWNLIARAAILAMRFPTLPMIVAASNIESPTNHDVWKAMIKAALDGQ